MRNRWKCRRRSAKRSTKKHEGRVSFRIFRSTGRIESGCHRLVRCSFTLLGYHATSSKEPIHRLPHACSMGNGFAAWCGAWALPRRTLSSFHRGCALIRGYPPFTLKPLIRGGRAANKGESCDGGAELAPQTGRQSRRPGGIFLWSCSLVAHNVMTTGPAGGIFFFGGCPLVAHNVSDHRTSRWHHLGVVLS